MCSIYYLHCVGVCCGAGGLCTVSGVQVSTSLHRASTPVFHVSPDLSGEYNYCTASLRHVQFDMDIIFIIIVNKA